MANKRGVRRRYIKKSDGGKKDIWLAIRLTAAAALVLAGLYGKYFGQDKIRDGAFYVFEKGMSFPDAAKSVSGGIKQIFSDD